MTMLHFNNDQISLNQNRVIGFSLFYLLTLFEFFYLVQVRFSKHMSRRKVFKHEQGLLHTLCVYTFQKQLNFKLEIKTSLNI